MVDVHLYKNISLTHYRVPQKFLKFIHVMRKGYASVNICDNQNGIMPCNLKKKFFWALYGYGLHTK